jgi:hypothetical protein
MQREIRVGVGLCENGRMMAMWFRVQIQAARTVEEYGAPFVGYVIGALRALSPE